MTPTVGHALVTDPGGAAGGGYTLVASSAAVASSDAEFLARTSQVTDFLHLQGEPGPFLSLYDLPSGAWAFTRRFVSGKRRGDYNRVVVHSLVMFEEVLEAVAWDPWQLLGKNRFRLAEGDEPVSFPALGVALADQAPEMLPDLRLNPPIDPLAELVASLARRRAFLAQAWGGDRLRVRLSWTLDTLIAGERPLLPQSKEEEQVLAIAWLLLPVVDRRRTRWTTHLAVSAEDLFQLAAAPSGRGLVDEQPGGWRSPPTAGARTSSPAVAVLLGTFLRDDEGVAPEILVQCLLETRHSLLSTPGDLGREVAALGLLGDLPEEGHPTSAAFHAALRRVRVRVDEAVEVSGLPEAMVLRCAAATARNVAFSGGNETTPAVREIQSSILERLRLPGMLEPGTVIELFRGSPNTAILPWAVALVIDRLPAPGQGVSAREELADVLLHCTPGAGQSNTEALRREERLRLGLLARLAADLLRDRSGKALEVLSALGRSPLGIFEVGKRVHQAADVEALLAVVEFARREGYKDEAARMVLDFVVPLLSPYDVLPPSIPIGQVRYALSALRAAPNALGTAMRSWRDDLFDLVMDELRVWPREPAAAAIEAIASPGAFASAALPERQSLVGLAAHLQGLGLLVARWLPFALVEAAFLDRQGSPAERKAFVDFLADRRLEDSASASAVLAAAVRAGVPARDCHRALVRAALPGLAAVPMETVRDLTAVLKAASPREVVAWAGVVTAVAGKLDQGHGAKLRWNWWHRFGERIDEISAPPEAVVIFRLLSPREQIRSVEQSLPRVYCLEEGGSVDDLLKLFQDAVRDDPRLTVDLELALLRRDVVRRRLELDLAVRRAYELTWRDEERFRRALDDILPSLPLDRVPALFDLVLSPRIWPGAKAALAPGGGGLRPNSLEASLGVAGGVALGQLPVFEELAKDGIVLLTVGRFAGGHWEANPAVAERLLLDALDAARADYAAAFLTRAEATSPRLGYLRGLVEEGNLALLRRLSAAQKASWSWDLARHAGRISHALQKANRLSRRTPKP